MQVFIPVSIGEFLDKLSILEIKLDRITDEAKLKNVRHEHNLLSDLCPDEIFEDPEVQGLYADLLDVNEELWEIEDARRVFENSEIFDEDFKNHARAVYYTNDKDWGTNPCVEISLHPNQFWQNWFVRRALIKRQLNELLGSEIMEEKDYVQYGN